MRTPAPRVSTLAAGRLQFATQVVKILELQRQTDVRIESFIDFHSLYGLPDAVLIQGKSEMRAGRAVEPDAVGCKKHIGRRASLGFDSGETI